MVNKPLIYTGIGSRETPEPVLELMRTIAKVLAGYGWTLRSGGAPGADLAFECGQRIAWHSWDYSKGPRPQMPMAIFLPWQHFNGNASCLYSPSNEAYDMAASYHPNWSACSNAAMSLHARNCHQVLGGNLTTPSNYVLCYTEGGRLKGGTAQALRIAMDYKIPIFNFGAAPDPMQILESFENHLRTHHPDSFIDT